MQNESKSRIVDNLDIHPKPALVLGTIALNSLRRKRKLEEMILGTSPGDEVDWFIRGLELTRRVR